MRYETDLPFIDYCELWPGNYNLAKHRLSSLKNKLKNNKDLFNEFDTITKHYIKEDHVQIVPPWWKDSVNRFHPLFTSDKPQKARIVFDGYVHYPSEPFINDVLYYGPSLHLLIFDILIRFRTGKIGVVADME